MSTNKDIMKIQYTKNKGNDISIDYNQLIKLEIDKCRKDPVYFINNYCYIKHPIRGIIKFETYPFQDKVLREFNAHSWNLIKKSRQLGISTLIAAYIAWKLLTTESYEAIVIANKAKTAKSIIDKINLIYSKMPQWIYSGFGVHPTATNAFFVKLSNLSSIDAMASSEDAGRSVAGSLVIWDEMAFVRSENLGKSIWDAITSVLATGGDFIGLSTPKGVSGIFYREWKKALDGINGFNTIELNWRMHPDRDLAWREVQDRKLGARTARQECDGDFLSAGDSVISGDIINYYENSVNIEPIEKRYANNLWIFKPVESNTRYIISCDVGRGDSADFSAFHIINESTYEQCVEYYGKIPTTQYALHIFQLALEYNNAMVIVENNSIGWAVITSLFAYNYRKLFYSVKGKNIYLMTDSESIIDAYRETDKLVPGFSNHSSSRDLAILSLEEYIRTKKIIIYSSRTISELKTFVWKPNGRAEHMDGEHDDLILSLSFGLLILNFIKQLKRYGLDYTRDLLSMFDDGYNVNDEESEYVDCQSRLSFLSHNNDNNTNIEIINVDDQLNDLDNWTTLD